ncbi:hypothetical protein BRARA_B00336 [Brassica rapa]|uniref:Uncharacterized protein n=2 Tax=Brassica TaxID=3705 RepID=A0ABQ8E522_BRANA|nr:uncharacterized protein LOC103850392 [Brassica rapa]XP_013713294.2 uncharacterized protein LOC106416968 [Brassica napus]XP_048616962.1 uncharacterized protein LOC125588975 [Brassica napus]KAH0895588.1 hypothetical protein HID58_045156 [Brassica napus]KAH0936735.1 hypothetical protein HID58_004196 [Brassica napus]RID73169.1 hypothetical protein BRARA_B00336 [Brassica rapa]
MHQETLHYYNLWKLAVQERDEAKEQLMQSLAEASQLRQLFDTLLLYEEQIRCHQPETKDETTQNCNHNHFPVDSPSRLSSPSPLDFGSSVYSSPLDPTFPSSQMHVVAEKTRDYETVVLEMIGGVLPENGKFFKAVSEAGSLVESMFVTGPVPKWKNPPVLLSSQITVLSNSNAGNWNYGGLEFGSGIPNRSSSGKMSQFGLMS